MSPPGDPRPYLRPVDRRGLGEIVTWTSIVLVLGALNVIHMLVAHQNGEPTVNHELLGALTGAIVALIARGSQSASERSGSADAINAASAAMRTILEEEKAKK